MCLLHLLFRSLFSADDNDLDSFDAIVDESDST